MVAEPTAGCESTTAGPSREPILELRHITKRFPGVLANDDVSIAVAPGEVLALLGENGAGKSTLMNVVYGLLDADEGEMLVDGEVVEIRAPRDAIELRIGMVHQHFMLVEPLTVTENIVLGMEPTTGFGVIDRKSARAKVVAISERYGLKVDPDARVADLSVGRQQRVEILKALYRDARILILDEPTAVLTPQEVKELFEIVRELVAEGLAVVIITHKLDEVMAFADRIAVMRDGRVVGETTPSSCNEQSLARMMVGRDVVLRVDKGPAQPGEPVLEIRDLEAKDDRKLDVLKGVSLRGPRGRDRWHRRCQRQRSDRAGRGHHGTAAPDQRHRVAARRRHHTRRRTHDDSGRRLARARGPAPPRTGARVRPRRERRLGRPAPAALLQVGCS